MDYNKSADVLRLKEFGRNIQNMIAYVASIEDRQKRTALAQEMIRIMACLTPAQRETPENREKLWEQLYLMADYKLDIDCPIPVPQPKEILANDDERMPYSRNRPRFRQYGIMVQNMLDEALRLDEVEEQKALVTVTANYMKNLIKGADKDTHVEATVRAHLKEMTQGKLLFDLESMVFSKIQPQAPKALYAVPKNNRNSGYGQNKKSFGGGYGRPQGNNPAKKRFGKPNTGGGSGGGGYYGGGSGSSPGSQGSQGGQGGQSGQGSGYGGNQGNRPRRPRI